MHPPFLDVFLGHHTWHFPALLIHAENVFSKFFATFCHAIYKLVDESLKHLSFIGYISKIFYFILLYTFFLVRTFHSLWNNHTLINIFAWLLETIIQTFQHCILCKIPELTNSSSYFWLDISSFLFRALYWTSPIPTLT